MNKSNDHTLKEVLNEMLKEYRLSDKLMELKLVDWWPKIVGKLIAKHTTGIYLRNKKLYVTLDNAAIREELLYAKTKLLKSLNKHAGDNLIEEIIFK
jgi:predicted nucleic acid-binding Zn ribbon protein